MTNDSENLPPSTGESRCAVCNAALANGVGYIVRIDIFADPAWSDSGLSENESDPQETLTELISQIESMSTDELQDGVHRRFEYHICPRCQPKLLANPLGLPRITRQGTN